MTNSEQLKFKLFTIQWMARSRRLDVCILLLCIIAEEPYSPLDMQIAKACSGDTNTKEQFLFLLQLKIEVENLAYPTITPPYTEVSIMFTWIINKFLSSKKVFSLNNFLCLKAISSTSKESTHVFVDLIHICTFMLSLGDT